MVFKQTDLPEPVVPAISKWGILTKSNVEISPEVVLPIARLNSLSDSANFSELMMERKYTVSGFRLGISIPTDDLPGIGAITLTFYRKENVKRQDYFNQISREKSDAVSLVEVESDKGVIFDD